MTNILVIRLSAMGDVAMTVPVIKTVLTQNQKLAITFLTRKQFHPFFPEHDRLILAAADVNGEHKGILGLIKLFAQIRKSNFDAIVDLHDVLRSKILRILFWAIGVPVFKIDKGREEKHKLTRKNNKILQPSKPTHQRYIDVFNAINDSIEYKTESLELIRNSESQKIGIAPFAAHKGKQLPSDKTRALIEHLIKKSDYDVYLFGGGEDEQSILQEWAKGSDRIVNMSELSFSKQLETIQSLRVMVSMDSANMHLASIYRIPVVSIWGATHPYAGFLGVGQSIGDCVQRNDLECRPCSVFGDKTCWRGDWACLKIDLEEVLTRLQKYL